MSNKTLEQFLNCQNFTFDTFWREILYNCACNRFPRGVKYDQFKNMIRVRYEHAGQVKKERHPVPKDPYERYKLLMYIFKELLGLRSYYDIKFSRQELEELRLKINIDLDCDWKKLKSRSMRNQIIMNFAVTEASKRDLGVKGAMYLYNVIQLGFQFKQLTSNDVQYEKGVITSISGLEYDESTQKFIIINPQNPNWVPASRPIMRVKSNQLYQTINKWLRDYKTNYLLF